MSNSVLNDVQTKLKEVQNAVKPLPQGYQYKVRELCACIEILVEMYNDIQNGIIPEVLKEMREQSQSDSLVLPEDQSKTITLGNIEL